MTRGSGWDLASGVGLTATEAATARAVAGRKPGALINDPHARRLIRAVGVKFFVDLAEVNLEEADSGFALPRLVDWVAARTKFFDDFLSAAQGGGIKQVVLLGAGLDSRAYRLDWSPQTTVYEIDQPAVLNLKTSTMDRAGISARAFRIPIAADLAGDWERPLCANGFNPQLPTAWCAEGLLPYLSEEAVELLMDTVSALSAARSRLAVDSVIDFEALAAQIAASPSFSARPAESRVDIGANKTAPAKSRPDVAGYLDKLGWMAAKVDAAALFALHELPLLGDSLSLYQRIELITASAARPKRVVRQAG